MDFQVIRGENFLVVKFSPSVTFVAVTCEVSSANLAHQVTATDLKFKFLIVDFIKLIYTLPLPAFVN